jgi:hypothetical protein
VLEGPRAGGGSPPPTSAAGTRAPRWVVGAVVLLGAALLGTLLRGALPPDAFRAPVAEDVSLPDRGLVVEDPPPQARGAEPGGGPPALRCVPTGCEVWRREDARAGRVLVSGDLAVHVGQTTLTGIDAWTGEDRWTATRPRRDGIRRPVLVPGALHLDATLLLVTTGRDLVAYGPTDGTIRWARTMDGPVAQVDRLGEVVVVSSPVDERPLATVRRVEVLATDGELLWAAELVGVVSAALPHAQEVGVLLHADGDLVSLELATGAERWRRPTGEGEILVGPSGLVTLEVASGRFAAVDHATGRTLAETRVPGADRLQVLGPWIGVATDDELHVVAPDATTLMVRPGRWIGSSGTRLDGGVYLAWIGSDRSRVEVVRYRPDGEPLDTIVIPTASGSATACCAELETTDSGRLRLTVGEGRQVVDLDADLQAAAPPLLTATGPGRASSTLDDLTVVLHESGRLQVNGRRGTIGVFGADRAVSRVPLLVHGIHGLLRLDDAMIAQPTS